MPCCEKGNLTVLLQFVAIIQVLAAFCMMCLGASLVANEEVRVGLGRKPAATGAVAVVVSLLQMASIFCGKHGSREHNKFCLLIFFLLHFIGSLIVVFSSSATIEWSLQDEDTTFQKECASQGHSEDCQGYLFDEKRMRLRLLWKELFFKAQQESGSRSLSILEKIQTEGSCCGFDPPYSCNYGKGTEEWITAYLHSEDTLPSQCGLERYWFLSTTDCHFEINTANGTYIPGCPYLLPGGRCVPFDYTRGCVYHMRVYLVASAIPLLSALKVLTSVSFVVSFFSLSLFLKRKDNDVLPTSYLRAKVKPET